MAYPILIETRHVGGFLIIVYHTQSIFKIFTIKNTFDTSGNFRIKNLSANMISRAENYT
jgi:hypothetical protein